PTCVFHVMMAIESTPLASAAVRFCCTTLGPTVPHQMLMISRASVSRTNTQCTASCAGRVALVTVVRHAPPFGPGVLRGCWSLDGYNVANKTIVALATRLLRLTGTHYLSRCTAASCKHYCNSQHKYRGLWVYTSKVPLCA